MHRLSQFFICFLIFQAGFGQDVYDEKSEKFNKLSRSSGYESGYIILSGGNRVEGLIRKQMAELKRYQEVKFVNYAGEKRTFLPNEILEYGYGPEKYIAESEELYKIVSSGDKIELLERIYFERSFRPGSPGNKRTARYLRRTDSEAFSEIRKAYFDIDIIAFLSDCEDLVERIKSREFRYKDLIGITEYYNNRCDKK